LHCEEAQLYARALVSVVIPTRGRPEWVENAVRSALAQSYVPVEVIVVVDGLDPQTEQVLGCLADTRLKVRVSEENVGGAEARNIGVRAAHGEWIAFLDDDDTWLPDKLDKQMKFVLASQEPYPIVSSRILARGPESEQVLPRRIYTTDEEVSEYLFCRRSLAYGEGMLQTSTLLVKRELSLEIPFLKGLKRHQDWDWLLKVVHRDDVAVAMLPDVLTVMRVSGPGESLSASIDWEFSLEWARQNKLRMSRKAYSFFITTECVPRARKSQARVRTLLLLFWECIWCGRPGLWQMFLFFCFFAFSGRTHRRLRDRTIQAVTESRA
jgi:glycosyltransferase involved in cell wall biosynthesis